MPLLVSNASCFHLSFFSLFIIENEEIYQRVPHFRTTLVFSRLLYVLSPSSLGWVVLALVCYSSFAPSSSHWPLGMQFLFMH